MPDGIDTGPDNPFDFLTVQALQVVAIWQSLVKAGMPPYYAAVYLGTVQGTTMVHNAEEEEQKPDG